ncbi:DUF4012 domain-containing protein [Isoptericola sp. NEAU-Y5]|uniref:DUF4012 domain-containing protein n=1 Tax=Isoptericola luteus TaxID=2879484 RepID=A0ABS7ZH90_9MICO|nr:DUF4012 domain-containing protein [Isoptericola sp. NEAU-Y5]MCA5894405.1 DUF4012 domain-containing protein [Isoptericola sp. NEAU-Y5]
MSVDTDPERTRAGGDPTADAPVPAARRRHVGRWVVLVLCAVIVAVLVAAVLLVRDAMVARDALSRAATQVPAVEQELRAAVDPGAVADDAAPAVDLAASPALTELARQTATARAATDGPLWWLAARVPGVGPSAAAATDVAVVLDQVTDDVLPPLASVADAVSGLERTDDGAFDLTPLQDAAPRMAVAHDTVTDALARLEGIDPDALLPELAEPVSTLRDRVTDLAGVVATADRATTLLPTMLGADGPRTYLLLSLNPAELRAGGGIPGSLVLLRTDAGAIEVVRQVSTAAVGPFDAPVLPLHPDDDAAYTARLGTFVQDVTATPDFPTSARLAAEMWERSQGERVDGVVATDPVAVSYLLAGTGPVTVPVSPQVAEELGRDAVEVSAENAVDILLRRTYDVLDPATADVFYADVAATVLASVTSSEATPAAILAGFEHAADEHRLRVWSADETEQAEFDGTQLAGAFASTPRAADAVGVFLTDHVAGKMSAYLDASLSQVGSECTADGRVDTLELRLASNAPADAATSLPWYVAGLPGKKSEPGTIRLGVTVAGARGADVARLERDGAPFGGETRTTHDRATVSATVVLAPGEETTLRLAVPAAGTSSAGSTPSGHLEVWTTPTATMPGLHDLEVPTCG